MNEFVTFDNWDKDALILEVKRLETELATLRAENAELKAQWVSVEDRLPESEYTHVLAYIPEATQEWIGGCGIYHRDGWEWKHVTHWQPLPPPPEMSDV